MVDLGWLSCGSLARHEVRVSPLPFCPLPLCYRSEPLPSKLAPLLRFSTIAQKAAPSPAVIQLRHSPRIHMPTLSTRSSYGYWTGPAACGHARSDPSDTPTNTDMDGVAVAITSGSLSHCRYLFLGTKQHILDVVAGICLRWSLSWILSQDAD